MLNDVWTYVVTVGTAIGGFAFPLLGSALSALAGASFGAWTAQRIAERNRLRNELTKEIRDTNAAITLAFAFGSWIMGMKQQHFRRMKTDFDRNKTSLLEHLEKREQGQIQGNKPYQQSVDFRNLNVPNPPAGSLSAHVLDRLSVVGRPLALAVAIGESTDALRASIVTRNELIQEFKEKGADAPDFMERYFGLRAKNGQLDQRYSDTLDGMVLHGDNLIFFACLLCDDLKEHGEKLVERYRQRLGRKGVPKITQIDWTKARSDGLIPSAKGFENWLQGFAEFKKPPSRWTRVRRALRQATIPRMGRQR